ncbi:MULTISPECIES: serine hydrolase [Asticcacaulis]|uniref:serine hydrolase n=1 Tax=Asticcacaulis TaxID=76890 RepID=UPI001AE77F6A|nr:MULTISPECIES: serine hydrolase [Asticcacaulis]MBP2158730.1 CubicO group peptidase (beta-lactamase class C family) [Asticcacaulis solisilvae]MDR6799776.1 CubicO group peptidase (beta-lactamase class C family) [Asticcacaulis sp. BE141]
MNRLCPAAALSAVMLAVSPANPSAADVLVDTHIQQVTQQMPPPVLVRGEKPKVTSLDIRMAELRVPAVSIAVIHKGRIEWAHGFGVTRWNGPSVTQHTLFQAASISKPVFALAVLRLADTGQLDLQANVNDYLTSWKVPDSAFTSQTPVTLRALLSHTAGTTVHGFRGYEPALTLPTLTQILDGQSPANNSPVRVDTMPGNRYRYSGGGYVVAQAALQDLTGEPAAQYLQKVLLQPLGMKDSTFEQPLPASRAAEIAMAYRADGSQVEGGARVYPEQAAAGLWTTPTDLSRYALGVIAALKGEDGAILSAPMARIMLTPVLNHHGLGPRVGGRMPRIYFAHDGGNDGYRCLMVVYEDGEGAVVMTNSDNGGVLAQEVMRSVASAYGWPDFAPSLRTLVDVKPERLERLVGVYQFDDGSVYVVRRYAERLVGHELGQAPVNLFPSSDHEVFARDVDLVVDFKGIDDKVTEMQLGVGETERRGMRLTEARSQKVFAWLDSTERRFQAQAASPESEAAVRALLAGITAGKPDYRNMRPALADSISQQLPGLQQWLKWLGELKSLKFVQVDANGRDEYRGEFVQNPLRIFIRLNEDGRVESAEFAPG